MLELDGGEPCLLVPGYSLPQLRAGTGTRLLASLRHNLDFLPTGRIVADSYKGDERVGQTPPRRSASFR